MTVLGRGSKVIGGSIKTELTRELLKTVVARRLPAALRPDRPARRGRRVGLTEIGLPYAADPAITRHLARFLGQQAGSLHTGGADGLPLRGAVQRRRLQGGRAPPAGPRRRSPTGRASRSPSSSRPTSTWPWPAGAAYYGQVRRGKGVRIRGGVARSYYVGLETAAPAVPGVAPPIKALCVVPMGMEEGTEADVPGPELGLVVGEPAEFRFLGSTTRRDDPVGTILDRWTPEELQELAPLETALAADDGRPGETVPSGSTPTSPRSAPSSSGARAPATPAAGSSNSTSANRPKLEIVGSAVRTDLAGPPSGPYISRPVISTGCHSGVPNSCLRQLGAPPASTENQSGRGGGRSRD